MPKWVNNESVLSLFKKQASIRHLTFFLKASKHPTFHQLRFESDRVLIFVSDSCAVVINSKFKTFRTSNLNPNEVAPTDQKFGKCGSRLLEAVVKMKIGLLITTKRCILASKSYYYETLLSHINPEKIFPVKFWEGEFLVKAFNKFLKTKSKYFFKPFSVYFHKIG